MMVSLCRKHHRLGLKCNSEPELDAELRSEFALGKEYDGLTTFSQGESPSSRYSFCKGVFFSTQTLTGVLQ